MTDKIPTEEQNLRKRVLLPLGITLVIFLVLFLAVFQIYLQRELARNLDDHVTSVAKLYKSLLAERSDTMESLINLIQKDKALQNAMMRQDRNELTRLSNPLFRELLHDQDITHFYFHNPDSVNFLRAHKSDRFGDTIDRLTMKQARSGIQAAAGAEMGPLGTFTLRVVVPWFANNKIIGFIELGEEIEPLLEKLAEQTGSEMAILIKKGLLDQKGWQEGREMLGRAASWNYLPTHVLTATTNDQLIEKIRPFTARLFLSGQKIVALSLLQQKYRGRYLSLIDTSGQEVGSMLVLQDANATLNDYGISTVLVIVFCIFLGSALFTSAFTILGRTEQTLATARHKLIDEIDNTQKANIQLGQEISEKRAAELALQKTHDELEQRVIQRTDQLNQQKQLLEETLIEARQASDRIVGIMRSVDDALLVVDADDNLLLVNESAGSLLRLDPNEVIGKHVSSAIWIGTLRDQIMHILRKREGGVQFDFELGNADKGTSVIMQTHSSALVGPLGRYEGMIFLARDVTKDRSMDRLKSDFISVAAHELRTPLATILGFSELLLDDNIPPDSDREEFTRTIYEKADALSRLLDDMLDISRIESGRGLELFLEKVPVDTLLMPTIKQYQKREAERQINADLEDSEQLLNADPDKISQVMENLLSNAIKYSEGKSHITITGKAIVEGYHITISDQGFGMTPEQVNHAFDKFYRGNNADKAVKGTGIGLTIVKHIVEDHGGKIWIESRPGKGTNIHFLLPIA